MEIPKNNSKEEKRQNNNNINWLEKRERQERIKQKTIQ